MKNMFDSAAVKEIKTRLEALRPDSSRQWGTMDVAQMVAHCSAGMQLASGELRPPRKAMGRLIGGIIKPMALGDDKPMRKNSPTAEGLIVQDERDLELERERLRGLIDQFVADGPAGCTTYPHSFFGRLTPDEWSVLIYKHLDHHFRQFGA
jgi:hypothetical protein